MLSESDLTHSDLLRGHNQYVGRSLKMNGPFWWDTYRSSAMRLKWKSACAGTGVILPASARGTLMKRT
ncbi:hypothetical protein CWS43_26930 [Rahnella sp. AA]|nr:hypothetical protein CWS43_26930 [Rahnella sp. AA]